MLSRNYFCTMVRVLAVIAVLAATPTVPAAPLYSITALPAGTNPTGINAAGQIVGDLALESGERRAFVWSGGVMQAYGTLGGYQSAGASINDSGHITGYAGVPDGNSHAFNGNGGGMHNLKVFGGVVSSFGSAINAGGQVAGYYYSAAGSIRAFTHTGAGSVDLGTLGGSFAVANAINSAGRIVGISALDDTSPWLAHAFLYADGVMQDLGTIVPDASLSEATAINDYDQIAGHGWVRGSHHAFLYSDGVMHDLGTLGGRRSFAYGINNHGQVVGNSNDIDDSDYFAYLYSDGVMTNLNSLIDPGAGWILYSATGINDSGQIAAYGCRGDACGALLLELAAPVPEPGSLAMFAAGLGLLGWRRFSAACRRA